MAILMVSRGAHMILAGDEILRTQHGNNNAWCQNNELFWFDWSLVETERDMLEFGRGMIAFRRRHPCLTHNAFFSGKPAPGRDIPDICWHGIRLSEPAWHDPAAQFLACTVAGLTANEPDLHVILNMADAPVEEPLSAITGNEWFSVVDTFDRGISGIVPPENQDAVLARVWRSQPRSVAIFESRSLHFSQMPRA